MIEYFPYKTKINIVADNYRLFVKSFSPFCWHNFGSRNYWRGKWGWHNSQTPQHSWSQGSCTLRTGYILCALSKAQTAPAKRQEQGQRLTMNIIQWTLMFIVMNITMKINTYPYAKPSFIIARAIFMQDTVLHCWDSLIWPGFFVDGSFFVDVRIVSTNYIKLNLSLILLVSSY